MKKHFSVFLFCLFFMCTVGSASAALLTYDFTADNRAEEFEGVAGFSVFGPESTTAIYGVSKSSGWEQILSGTFEYDFAADTTYTLQWRVTNDAGTPTSTNPMAFLGMFSVFGENYVSSVNSPWQVNGEAPTFASLLTDSNAWNSGKTALVDFFNDKGVIPYWIGFQSGDRTDMLVTASFTTPSAVPIPGAALLLGAGLLGIVGIRRKQSA